MSIQTYNETQWQALHEEIQQRFRALIDKVNTATPGVQVRCGRTGTQLFLFSHVSFNKVRTGDNDIIVGVDIISMDGQWRIDADVSEEEEGTIFFELPNPPFSVSSFNELRVRVLAATDELINGGKPVLLQLFGVPTPRLPSQPASLREVAPKG